MHIKLFPGKVWQTLAAIVYGLSSTNCLCSLELTINEPNSKLQTTNKPPGRKYTYKLLHEQFFSSHTSKKKEIVKSLWDLFKFFIFPMPHLYQLIPY